MLSQPVPFSVRIPTVSLLPRHFMDHTANQLCSLRLPTTMPVMVLDDCYLFPGCFLPLFIFEERYRKMLTSALNTDRMFCIGCPQPGDKSGTLSPISTAALVRACRKQNDGTSHVMLYGISRIRFTGWQQEKPFRLATIEPAPTTWTGTSEELNRLKALALAMLPKPAPQCSEAMQVLRTTLAGMPCPEMVCDILAYHFVKKPDAQRALLLESNLETRFQHLLDELALLPAAE